MFLSVDGGRSQTSSFGTSRGGRHQRFLALIVGAPRLLSLAPHRGPLLMFLSVDGGCSQTSSFVTSWGPAIDVS
jgi:hypothetical protein